MKRLPEIDALRGLAVLCMVGFHLAMDGFLLGLWEFHPYEGWNLLWVRVGQFLFLGLVGISVCLSSRGFKGQLMRGAGIFSYGLLVTLATWLIFPEEYVRFGVLHLIGVSVPFLVLFKGKEWWALGTAILLCGLAYAIPWFIGDWGSVWTIPLGLPPTGFTSLDYFPFVPWFAVPLVGLWLGSLVYVKGRKTALASLERVSALLWLGRHSLAVYLLHQPVLYFSLWAISQWIS